MMVTLVCFLNLFHDSSLCLLVTEVNNISVLDIEDIPQSTTMQEDLTTAPMLLEDVPWDSAMPTLVNDVLQDGWYTAH